MSSSASSTMDAQRHRFYVNAREILDLSRDPPRYKLKAASLPPADNQHHHHHHTSNHHTSSSPQRSDGGDSRVNDTKLTDAAVRLQMFVASRILLKNYFLAKRMEEEEAADREREEYLRQEAGKAIALFVEARVAFRKLRAVQQQREEQERADEAAAFSSGIDDDDHSAATDHYQQEQHGSDAHRENKGDHKADSREAQPPHHQALSVTVDNTHPSPSSKQGSEAKQGGTHLGGEGLDHSLTPIHSDEEPSSSKSKRLRGTKQQQQVVSPTGPALGSFSSTATAAAAAAASSQQPAAAAPVAPVDEQDAVSVEVVSKNAEATFSASATRYSDLPSDNDDMSDGDDERKQQQEKQQESDAPFSIAVAEEGEEGQKGHKDSGEPPQENLVFKLLSSFESKETTAAVRIQCLARKSSARRRSQCQRDLVSLAQDERDERCDVEDEASAAWQDDIVLPSTARRVEMLTRDEAIARVSNILKSEQISWALLASDFIAARDKLQRQEEETREDSDRQQVASEEHASRVLVQQQAAQESESIAAARRLREEEEEQERLRKQQEESESDLLLQVVSSTIEGAVSISGIHSASALRIQSQARRHRAQVQELTPRRMTRAIANDERVEREINEVEEGDESLVLDLISRELQIMHQRFKAAAEAFHRSELETRHGTEQEEEKERGDLWDAAAVSASDATASHEMRVRLEKEAAEQDARKKKEEEVMTQDDMQLLAAVTSEGVLEQAVQTVVRQEVSALQIQSFARGYISSTRETSPRKGAATISHQEEGERSEILTKEEEQRIVSLQRRHSELLLQSNEIGSRRAIIEGPEAQERDLLVYEGLQALQRQQEEEDARTAAAAAALLTVQSSIETAHETTGRQDMSALKIQSFVRGHAAQQEVSPRRAMAQLCGVDERVDRELLELNEEDEREAMVSMREQLLQAQRKKEEEEMEKIKLQQAAAAANLLYSSEATQREIVQEEQVAERVTVQSIALSERGKIGNQQQRQVEEAAADDSVSSSNSSPARGSSGHLGRKHGSNSPVLGPAPTLQGTRGESPVNTHSNIPAGATPSHHQPQNNRESHPSDVPQTVSRELAYDSSKGTPRVLSPPPSMRFLRGQLHSPQVGGSIVSLEKRLRSVMWILDALAEGSLLLSSISSEHSDDAASSFGDGKGGFQEAEGLLATIATMFAAPTRYGAAQVVEVEEGTELSLGEWYLRFSDDLTAVRSRVKAYMDNATPADLQVILHSDDDDGAAASSSSSSSSARMADGTPLSVTQRMLLLWPPVQVQRDLLAFSERRDRAAVQRLEHMGLASLINLWNTSKSLAEEVSDCMRSAYVTRDRQLRISELVSQFMDDEVHGRIRIRTAHSMEFESLSELYRIGKEIAADVVEREHRQRNQIENLQETARSILLKKALSQTDVLLLVELHLGETILFGEESAARVAIAKENDAVRQGINSSLSTALFFSSERQLIESQEHRSRVADVIQAESLAFAVIADQFTKERDTETMRQHAQSRYTVLTSETHERSQLLRLEQTTFSGLMEQLNDLWSLVLNGYIRHQEFVHLQREAENERRELVRDETRLRKIIGDRFDEVSGIHFQELSNSLGTNEREAREQIEKQATSALGELRPVFTAELVTLLSVERQNIASRLTELLAEEKHAREAQVESQEADFWYSLGPLVELKLRYMKYQNEPQQRAGIHVDEAFHRQEILDALAVTVCSATNEVRERVYNSVNNEQRRVRLELQTAESIGWEFLARKAAVSSSEIQRRLLITEQEGDFWTRLQETISDSSPARSRPASAIMAHVGARATATTGIPIPERLLAAKATAPSPPTVARSAAERLPELPVATPKRPISAVLPQRPPGAPLPARPLSSKLRREEAASAADRNAPPSVAVPARPSSTPFSAAAAAVSRPDSTYSDYGIYTSDSPEQIGSDVSPDSASHNFKCLYRTLLLSISKELEDPAAQTEGATPPTAAERAHQLLISLEDLTDVLYAIPTFKLSSSISNPATTSSSSSSSALAGLWTDVTFVPTILSKLELMMVAPAPSDPRLPIRISLEQLCYATLGAVPLSLEFVSQFDFAEFCAEIAVNGFRKIAQLKLLRHLHTVETAFGLLDIHRSRLLPRALVEAVFSGFIAPELKYLCRTMNGFSFAGFATLLADSKLDEPSALMPIIMERFFDKFVWNRISSAGAKREKLVQLGLLSSQMKSAAQELADVLKVAIAPIPGSKHKTFAPEEDYATSRLMGSLDANLAARDAAALVDFAIVALSCGLFYPGLGSREKADAFATVVEHHYRRHQGGGGAGVVNGGAVLPTSLRSSILSDLWHHLSSASFLDQLNRIITAESSCSALSPRPCSPLVLQFGQLSLSTVEYFCNLKLEVPESLAANERAQVDLYRYKRIQHVNALLTGLRHLLISFASMSKFWRFSSASSSSSSSPSPHSAAAAAVDEEIQEAEGQLFREICVRLIAPRKPAAPFVSSTDLGEGADEEDLVRGKPLVSRRFADVLFGLGGERLPSPPKAATSPREHREPLPPPPPPAPVRPAWASPRAPGRDEATPAREAAAAPAARPASAAAATVRTVAFAIPSSADPSSTTTSLPAGGIEGKGVASIAPTQRPHSAQLPTSPPNGAKPPTSFLRQGTNSSPAPTAGSSSSSSVPVPAQKTMQASSTAPPPLAPTASPAVKELLRIFAQTSAAVTPNSSSSSNVVGGGGSPPKIGVFYMAPRHLTPKH